MNTRNHYIADIKGFIKSIPVLGSTARKLANLPVVVSARRLTFRGSASYWEARYRDGGTSGAGSYGRLAEFKAEILNKFIRTMDIRTVIEFGCGDGAQLELARYPEYVGVDVATTSVQRCSKRFAPDHTKRFYMANTLPNDLGTFDLALSLDVIYHLVEDSVFDFYMHSVFARSHRHVVIYSSNHDAESDMHVRHRKFTAWIAENALGWQPTGTVSNRFPFDPHRPEDTSCADFYFFTRKHTVERLTRR